MILAQLFFVIGLSDPGAVVDVFHGVLNCLSLLSLFLHTQYSCWNLTTRYLAVTGGDRAVSKQITAEKFCGSVCETSRRWFEVNMGVRQGSFLSPQPWMSLMDQVLKQRKQRRLHAVKNVLVTTNCSNKIDKN